MQLTFSKGTLKCTWKKNTQLQGSNQKLTEQRCSFHAMRV